jgi:hypothetical protein
MSACVHFYPASIHIPHACMLICVTWLKKIILVFLLGASNEISLVAVLYFIFFIFIFLVLGCTPGPQSWWAL